MRKEQEQQSGGAAAATKKLTHTHTHTLPLDDPQDYAKFREIADTNGSLLMCDMAHISGLVATGNAKSPFEFCDIVTTTTHKSLRGPRAGLIFYKKDARGFEEKINMAVFPGLQGGPHEHQIAGVATQLKEVLTPAFKVYATQVVKNCRAMAEELKKHGHKLCTDGTDNHLILWDLRPEGLTGSKVEKTADMCSITLNKNAVYGDRSALSPGGVRVGTPALTTRGLKEDDFRQVGSLLGCVDRPLADSKTMHIPISPISTLCHPVPIPTLSHPTPTQPCQVARFLHRLVEICKRVQKDAGKRLRDFLPAVEKDAELATLRDEVHRFATKFPMPGFSVDEMEIKEL